MKYLDWLSDNYVFVLSLMWTVIATLMFMGVFE